MPQEKSPVRLTPAGVTFVHEPGTDVPDPGPSSIRRLIGGVGSDACSRVSTVALSEFAGVVHLAKLAAAPTSGRL